MLYEIYEHPVFMAIRMKSYVLAKLLYFVILIIAALFDEASAF